MAITRFIGTPWRDEQSDSRYPFADSATLRSRTGMQLRRDLLLDAVVYPPGLTAGASLTNVHVTARLVTFSIGDARKTERATASYDPLADPATLESVRLKTPDDRAAGLLVADPTNLAELQSWPLGDHPFTIAAGELAAGVVVPSPSIGLTGFRLPDGTLVSGEVWFVAEDGIVIRVDQDGNLRLDVVGDETVKRRLCEEAGLLTPARPFRTLNGISPSAGGAFEITIGPETPDTVLRVTAEPPDILKFSIIGRRAQG